MKPTLTISVRRGLKTLSRLAAADVDADRATECPQFKGRDLSDIDKALAWVACLDDKCLDCEEMRESMVFTPMMIEAIYAAWHGAGVDIAGGNWGRFVGMLPMA